jgi:hypothetical protein
MLKKKKVCYSWLVTQKYVGKDIQMRESFKFKMQQKPDLKQISA